MYDYGFFKLNRNLEEWFCRHTFLSFKKFYPGTINPVCGKISFVL
jgi:hypothetical protein